MDRLRHALGVDLDDAGHLVTASSGPTAANPWTVTLAWTPDQNSGRVSVLNGRAPVLAIISCQRASDWLTPDADIAAEFGITVEELGVLSVLAHDLAPLRGAT